MSFFKVEVELQRMVDDVVRARDSSILSALCSSGSDDEGSGD
jgi:hypothetical protein